MVGGSCTAQVLLNKYILDVTSQFSHVLQISVLAGRVLMAVKDIQRADVARIWLIPVEGMWEH